MQLNYWIPISMKLMMGQMDITKLILQFAACLLRNVYKLPWGIRFCWKTDSIITANVA